MISFACSGCQRTLRVPDHQAGKRARCPACDAATPIPSAPTVSVQEAPTLAPPPNSFQPTLGPAGPAGRAPLVPGYEIEGELGRGGMGVVYKARQQRPRRIVALKMVLAGEHAGADALARFRQEAEAVARLQHPNIVAVHEVGEHDGRPYFSLEYVEGGTLAMLLRNERLGAREAAELLLATARAVDFAHKKGVLHRDLKPGNILLAPCEDREEDGPRWQPKIADFGLAKQLDEMASVAPAGPRTASGAVLGTPSYMAPEQAGGKTKEIGPASDVYSLGAILYEMLGGRPPFEAGSMLDVLMKVATEEPTPLRQLRPKVPRDLETICHKCLRKAPGERYASAKELADDLKRYLDGEPIKARPPGAWGRLRRRLAKHKALMYIGGSALLAACLSAAVLAFLSRDRGKGPVNGRPIAAGPADLRLVPRRDFGFVSVRVADLWGRPEMGQLAKALDLLPRDVANLDEAAKRIEKELTLGPADVERFTLAIPTFASATMFGLGFGPERDKQPGSVWIVRTTKAYDFTRLRTAMEKPWGGLVRQEHNGHVLFRSGKDDAGPCLCPIDEQVLVVGRTMDVKRLLDKADQPDADGPLDDALALAEQGTPLVAAFRPPSDGVDNLQKTALFAGTALAPLKSARVVTLALAPGPTVTGGALPDVDLDLSVRFDNEEQAAQAMTTSRHVLDTLFTAANEGTRDSMARVFVDPVLSAYRAAKWEQDGAVLRLPVRGRWTEKDLKAIQAFVAEQQLAEQSAANLRQIGRALFAYARKHGGLPPAVIRNPRGEPLFSWRVAILPFTDEARHYSELHVGRAWDHPANKTILARRPALFAAPGPRDGTHTYYQALVGPDTAFGPTVRPFTHITDGTSNTLLVVEGNKIDHWAAPVDVAFEKGKRPAVGGLFKDRFHGLMGDGVVRRFPRTISETTLYGLGTRAGNERVSPWGYPIVGPGDIAAPPMGPKAIEMPPPREKK